MAFMKAVDKAKLHEDQQKHVRECYICNEIFTDPRLLDCYHTFCFDCIQEYIETNSRGNMFGCPLCKADIKLSEQGPRALEKNCFVGDARAGDEQKQSCDVCGEKSRAKAFCYECNQKLCNFCVTFHEKLQATKDHNIAAIDESGVRKVKRKLKCPQHNKNELQYFCDECNILICIDCNMTSHKLHKSRDVVLVADECRQELAKEVNKDEYHQHLKALSDFSQNRKKKRDANEGKEGALMDAIERQLAAIQNALADIKLDFISDISETGWNEENKGKQGMNLMERNFKSFAALYFFSKLLLEQGDDTAIVMHTVNLRERLKLLSGEDTGKSGSFSQGKIVFEPGNLNKKALRDLFGKLRCSDDDDDKTRSQTGKPICVSKFDCPPGDCMISGIAPTTEGTAWICIGSESVVHLFAPGGQCLKTVSFSHPLDDVTFFNGRVYITSNGTKMIRTVDNRGQKSVYMKTEICVRGITTDTRKKRITASCVENDVFFNSSLDDISSIIHIEKEHGISNIPSNRDVQYPARLALDKKGNLAISDWISQTVIIQNENGKTVSIYKGRKQMKSSERSKINPRGICTDDKGNIFVVDIETDTVQLLNSAGEHRRDILTKDDGLESPWSVAYDSNDCLWVGSQHGTIMVFDINCSDDTEADNRANTVNSGRTGANTSHSRNKNGTNKMNAREADSRGSNSSNESRRERSRRDT